MNAMLCEKETVSGFEKRLANQFSERVYIAKQSEKTVPVTFHFNFSPANLKNAVLVVFSNKVNSIIYRDAYNGKFTIQAGADLLRDGDGDSFEIFIFNKETNEICIAAHQSIPAWQANKTVHFDLLPSRDVDKRNGQPISFSVRVE